jgi:hypothetical protein
LLYDNAGGLNITSYTTGSGTLDRFTVDGAYGRLFGVSDSVTGTIFSVNDAAGLPVIEVESNLTDKITMGTYGTNTLVVDNVSVGIGTGTPSGKLHIVDATLAGTGFLSGSALNIQQTWNTSGAPTAIKLNVFDIASTGTSNLMDLQVSGTSKLTVRKDGQIIGSAGSALLPTYGFFDANWGAGFAGWHKFGDTVACSAAGGTQTPFSISHVAIRIQHSIPFGWTNGNAASALDTILIRDGAANIIAQRNGLAPQESRIYGTYTNATNFERLNLKYNSTDSAFQIGTEKGFSGTARPLQLQTDGATRMTLSTGGNVGIGTTTPDTKLYVVGKLAVNSSNLGGKALDVYTAEAGSPVVIQSNGLTNGDGILQLAGAASSGVAYALRGSVQSNGAGIITIQQNGVGDAVLEALSISVGDSMSRYLINGGASYSVGIDNSDGDKFKISNSSVLGTNDRLVINDSGYIGIGTITPSSLLNIYGAGPKITLEGTTNSSPGVLFKNSAGTISLGTNSVRDLTVNDNTAGTSRLVIRSNGAVGIGDYYGPSNYPQNKLSVNGSASIGYATSADVAAPSNSLIVNGSVGIGTGAPDYKLDVNGTTRLGGNVIVNADSLTMASSGWGQSFGLNYGGPVTHRLSTNYDLELIGGVGAGRYVAIKNGTASIATFTEGKVGIGTGSPSGKLDILDTTLAGPGLSGSVLNLNQTWNTTGIPTAIKLNVTDTASNAASNLMDLQVTGVSKLKVDKNGSVIISSTVNGTTYIGVGSPTHGALYNRKLSLDDGVFVTAAGDTFGSNGWGFNSANGYSFKISTNTPLRILPAGIILSAPVEHRSGLSPQTYRIYNTYTSDTNFERLNFRWDSLVAKIGTSQGSVSGLARDLVLETSGTERVRITASGLFSADGVSFGKGGSGIASNLAIGQSSLVKNISGNNNLAIGQNTLSENTNGNFNVAIGKDSLKFGTGGFNNIAIGQNALANEQGSYTVAIGQDSLSNSSNGNFNVAIGQASLGNANQSYNNVTIGYNAGLYDVSSGIINELYDSVFIGSEVSPYGAGGEFNCIAIGYKAGGMTDNSAVFGNDSITNTYLKGVVQIHKTGANLTNYERIAMRWNGDIGTIGTSKAGTGVATALAFETNGTARMTIAAGGNVSNSALFSTSGFAYTGIAPATTGAPGVSGEMAFSANFLYRHNGTNWQRTGIGFANW